MKNVSWDSFKKPVVHKNVEIVVFHGEARRDARRFYLGFLPEDEFIYDFNKGIPDVYFQGLPIKEVYYEPYRTFLHLEYSVDIEICWEEVNSDKLCVRKIKP